MTNGEFRQATRTLFGRGSAYTLATALQLSAGVLVLPVLTRVLPARELGTVAAGLVLTNLLGVAAAAGVPAGITREFFDPEGRFRAAALVPAAVLLSVAVATVAHLSAPAWVSLFATLKYGLTLKLAVWSSVPATLLASVQSLLRAQNRPGWFVSTAVLATAGGQAMGLVLVAAYDRGSAGYMLGVAAGVLAGGLVGLLAGRVKVARLPSRELLRAALLFGLPTVPHGMAVFALSSGDRLILERLKGLDAVGRYQVAYAVGAVAVTVLAGWNNAWGPMIYGAEPEQRWRLLAETTQAVFPVAAVMATGMAVGAPLALLLVAPGSYAPADLAPVSALVAAAVLPYALYLAAAHVLFQVRATKVLAWATPAAAAANLLLNLALVPSLGLSGAGLATLLAYGVWAGLALIAARRRAAVPFDGALYARWSALAAFGVLTGLAMPARDAGLLGRAVISLALLGWFTLLIFRLVRQRPAVGE